MNLDNTKVLKVDISFSNGVPSFSNPQLVTVGTNDESSVIGLEYIENETNFKLIKQPTLVSGNTTHGIKIYNSSDGTTWESDNYDTNIPYEEPQGGEL